MKKIALLAAIIVGAACMALFIQHKTEFEDRVSGGEPVPVLVATQTIPLGEIVQEGMLAVRDIPEDYIMPRHIRASDANRVVGIRTSMALHADETILWTDLAVASEQKRFLSGLVKLGMRATTVRIEQGATLNGMLRPGDRIDLFLRALSEDQPVIVPILENVLVLAVGGDIGSADPVKNILASAMGGSDLTVSVTVEQAQVLALAQGEGSLRAIVRNPDDILVETDRPHITLDSIRLASRRTALQERRKTKSTKKDTAGTEIEHVR